MGRKMQMTGLTISSGALRRFSMLLAAAALAFSVAACASEAGDDGLEESDTTEETNDPGDDGGEGTTASRLSFSGSGDDQTEPFDVAANWELRWESDGAFQAELFNPEGESRGVIIETDEAGDGATFISEAGEFTLEVSADEDWSIEVVDRSGS
jgi:hypothetical protein